MNLIHYALLPSTFAATALAQPASPSMQAVLPDPISVCNTWSAYDELSDWAGPKRPARSWMPSDGVPL
jgi:hypothetical protein